jgi:ribonucleotide monophosphatase NagD (HAD superfamily)
MKGLTSRERTAIIGDRLDTDIVGGKRVGIKTILVLSGSTKEDEISKSEIKPDYVINDLRDLLKEEAQ